MSNKALITTIIIVIVIIGVGAIVYARMHRTSNSPQTTAQSSSVAVQATPTPTEAATAASSSTSTQTSMTCNRDFDSNKLAQNANIDIANREVAINVQGYGTITMELYDKDAPNTVRNFLRLVDAGYYDCLTFHRVAAGFVIQGGDPTGTGSGGQTASGQPLQDELNPNTPSYQAGYQAGVVAMAETSQPNTGTSQFFIMLADNATLPHAYPIFGKVISGMDVVQKIGQVQTNPPGDGQPVTPVVMESVKIIK